MIKKLPLFIILIPAICFASDGHQDLASQLRDYAWRMLNFSFLVVILYFLAKKINIKQLLSERRIKLEEALSEAKKVKEEAEKKLALYNEKIEELNIELEKLKKDIVEQGEFEKQRIISEAEKSAELIRQQAYQIADQEIKKAKESLRLETSKLAMEIAKEKVISTVNEKDHETYVNQYLDRSGK